MLSETSSCGQCTGKLLSSIGGATAQANNKHISACPTTLPSMLTNAYKAYHEEEQTQVLTQHVSAKSANTGLRRAGFCLRRALL